MSYFLKKPNLWSLILILIIFLFSSNSFMSNTVFKEVISALSELNTKLYGSDDISSEAL